MKKHFLYFFVTALILTIITSCSFFSDAQKLKFHKFDVAQIIINKPTHYQEGLKAFAKSCYKLKGNLKEICKKNDLSYKYLVDNFDIYQIQEGSNFSALYTGYYEIELNGSRKKSKKYPYPLYKKPQDESLRTLTREQIVAGGLKGKSLEIAYVDDYAREFFLQIQGSGRVKLENGKYINVGYAGKNGQKYLSIGKWFIDQEIFTKENITALKIMDWLRKNPEKADYVMNLNQSYVFFEEREKRATGSFGVPLVKEGSVAVDRSRVQLGLPIFIMTDIADKYAYNKLLIAQDTGGAIKSALRGDIFFGSGKRAEILASQMKNRGIMFVLVPKGEDPKKYLK